jgi:hypothetical protein
MDPAHLEKTTKEFLESLLNSKHRHTLCLNIAEPGFNAEDVAKSYLSDRLPVDVHHEPSVTDFEHLLAALEGKLTIVTFTDLDGHPKVISALLKHVKHGEPKGKLVVVTKEWNADNTIRERQLRKFCLFYQQNLAKPPKT